MDLTVQDQRSEGGEQQNVPMGGGQYSQMCQETFSFLDVLRLLGAFAFY